MATSTVDLEMIVEAWAKDYFRRKATGWREKRLFSRDHLGIRSDWKRILFTHTEPRYEPEPPKVGTGVPLNNCLFHTTYTNKTNTKQHYNFKGERATRSSCAVELEQTYTQGFEMGITLTPPGGILEANLGFHREMEVTKVTGEVSEEELVWGVNSDIEVKERHKAEARMVITEEEYKGMFTLKTVVKGIVHVVFTNMKDNNSFIRAADVDIYELMDWAKRERIVPSSDLVTLESSTKEVIFTTKGKCTFKYGLKQDVEVDQQPL